MFRENQIDSIDCKIISLILYLFLSLSRGEFSKARITLLLSRSKSLLQKGWDCTKIVFFHLVIIKTYDRATSLNCSIRHYNVFILMWNFQDHTVAFAMFWFQNVERELEWTVCVISLRFQWSCVCFCKNKQTDSWIDMLALISYTLKHKNFPIHRFIVKIDRIDKNNKKKLTGNFKK